MGRFTQLRPGTYSVVVTHKGFRRYQRDSVTVLVASPTALDVQVALMEFKSQAGPSYGNNCNNRVEEAHGNATSQRA